MYLLWVFLFPFCLFADLQEAAEEAKPGVVCIMTTVAEGYDQSSGFVISPSGYILTTAHAVVEALDIQVSFRESFPSIAQLVDYDVEMDLALLKVDHSALTYFELEETREIQEGDHIVIVGYGDGFLSHCFGKIVSPEDENGVFYVNISSGSVNSGSPILNLQGQMIGMITHSLSSTLSCGVSSQMILQALSP